MLTELSCDKLGDLDNGTVRALVNSAIQSAVADLDDRGEQDGKPREVTIKLSIVNAKGLLGVTVQVATKIPEYRSGGTAAKVAVKRGKGNNTVPILQFQEFNDENPDQPTDFYDKSAAK